MLCVCVGDVMDVVFSHNCFIGSHESPSVYPILLQ